MGTMVSFWISTLALLALVSLGLYTLSLDHEPGVVEDKSTSRLYRHICYDGYKYLVFDAPNNFGLAQVLEEGPFGVRPVRCGNDAEPVYKGIL